MLSDEVASFMPSVSQSMPSNSKPYEALMLAFQALKISHHLLPAMVVAGCGRSHPPIVTRCVTSRPSDAMVLVTFATQAMSAMLPLTVPLASRSTAIQFTTLTPSFAACTILSSHWPQSV